MTDPRFDRYSPDFGRAPYLVIWEVTRACDLACVHCRAEAIPTRSPFELSTVEGFMLLEEIARFGDPVVVLTGGDPLKRPDIQGLIRHGTNLGLKMTMTPSGTPLMTPEALRGCQAAGLKRLAVSLDGSTAERHDGFRRVPGSFEWSVRMLKEARAMGLPTQVNTTITRYTRDDMDNIAELVTELGISLWSVFFLVPVGRGKPEEQTSAAEFEDAFRRMYEWSKTKPFDIKSTAAPHYRRYVVQQRVKEARLKAAQPAEAEESRLLDDGIARSPKAVNDGNGLVFVSHTGNIYPSGFMPVSAGNVRRDSLLAVYRNSPLFRDLRNTNALKGKCGMCEFRNVCGGSRARAFALTGDVREAEPYCDYVPPAYAQLVKEGKAPRPEDYFKGRAYSDRAAVAAAR